MAVRELGVALGLDEATVRHAYGPATWPDCTVSGDREVVPFDVTCTGGLDRVDPASLQWALPDGTTGEGTSVAFSVTTRGTYTVDVCGASNDAECAGDEVCGSYTFTACDTPAPIVEVAHQDGLNLVFEDRSDEPEACVSNRVWIVTNAGGAEIGRSGEDATGRFDFSFPSAGTYTVALYTSSLAGSGSGSLEVTVEEAVDTGDASGESGCGCSATPFPGLWLGGVAAAGVLGRRRRQVHAW